MADQTKPETERVEDRPLITVAMRHYNNAPFVEAALSSAFAQTYSPLEIIFIDDCSTDAGYEIAQRAIAGYKGPHRVIITRNERNLGLGGQLVRILKLSKGEIVVFADADDISMPQRSQRIYEAYRKGGNHVMCVLSFFDPINSAGEAIKGVAPELLGARSRSDSWTREMLARGVACPTGAVSSFRRKVLETGAPLDDLLTADDMVCGLRAALLGRIETVPEVLVLRRVHATNISGELVPEQGAADYKARFARQLGKLLAVPYFMGRDIDKYERDGVISYDCARALRREVLSLFRILKTSRVMQRISPIRVWLSYFTLRRLGLGPREGLKRVLWAAWPSLAIKLWTWKIINRFRID